MFGFVWYDKINDELLDDQEAKEECNLCFEEIAIGCHSEGCGQEIGTCETLHLIDLKHFMKTHLDVWKELKRIMEE